MEKEKYSVIVVQNGQLDWIKKHPDRFVNGVVSRCEHGEVDPRPGHARWHGDALPGVQVVHVGDDDFTSVVATGHGRGVKVGVTYSRNDGSEDCNLDILKQLLGEMGYTVTRTDGTPAPKKRRGRPPKKKNNSRITESQVRASRKHQKPRRQKKW